MKNAVRLIFVLFALPSMVSAQTKIDARALGLRIGAAFPKTSYNTVFAAALDLDVAELAPHLRILPYLEFSHGTWGETDHQHDWRVFALGASAVRFNTIRYSTTQPFWGGGFGIAYGNSGQGMTGDELDFALNALAGVRTRLAESLSVTLMVKYTLTGNMNYPGAWIGINHFFAISSK